VEKGACTGENPRLGAEVSRLEKELIVFWVILLSSLLFFSSPAQAGVFDHSGWGALLKAHVRVLDSGEASQVDYAGLSARRNELRAYLRSLSAVSRDEFDSWSTDEQLAFLLNAYNSWTVELILTRYPDIDSIKDLGSFFQSPWKIRFVTLFGEKVSLDDIEHEMIRGSGRYNDPRIHFAVNCASIGCPALRPEPYRGQELQHQLADATHLFLMDRSRNRLEGKVLQVSAIFKWYRGDFEQGLRSIDSLEQFFADHAEALQMTEEEKKQLLSGKIAIEFLDYDWELNSIR
jgi:hypothetical protein